MFLIMFLVLISPAAQASLSIPLLVFNKGDTNCSIEFTDLPNGLQMSPPGPTQIDAHRHHQFQMDIPSINSQDDIRGPLEFGYRLYVAQQVSHGRATFDRETLIKMAYDAGSPSISVTPSASVESDDKAVDRKTSSLPTMEVEFNRAYDVLTDHSLQKQLVGDGVPWGIFSYTDSLTITIDRISGAGAIEQLYAIVTPEGIQPRLLSSTDNQVVYRLDRRIIFPPARCLIKALGQDTKLNIQVESNKDYYFPGFWRDRRVLLAWNGLAALCTDWGRFIRDFRDFFHLTENLSDELYVAVMTRSTRSNNHRQESKASS